MYDPAGGGLYHQLGACDESGDTISLGRRRRVSARPVGPALVVGVLGADVRLAGIVNASGGGTSRRGTPSFRMQADGYARFAFGDQISLYLEGGIRGDVGRDQTFNDRIDSVTGPDDLGMSTI